MKYNSPTLLSVLANRIQTCIQKKLEIQLAFFINFLTTSTLHNILSNCKKKKNRKNLQILTNGYKSFHGDNLHNHSSFGVKKLLCTFRCHFKAHMLSILSIFKGVILTRRLNKYQVGLKITF